jgi:hypothetical protein
MTITVGINGFGRIGRSYFRALLTSGELPRSPSGPERGRERQAPARPSGSHPGGRRPRRPFGAARRQHSYLSV